RHSRSMSRRMVRTETSKRAARSPAVTCPSRGRIARMPISLSMTIGGSFRHYIPVYHKNPPKARNACGELAERSESMVLYRKSRPQGGSRLERRRRDRADDFFFAMGIKRRGRK